MSKKSDAEARELAAVRKALQQTEAKLKGVSGELAAVFRDNITTAEVREKIYGLEALIPDPPDWLDIVPNHDPDESWSWPIAMWSDWHYGETVFPDQVGGMNEFNRAIANERIRRLVDSTVSLAKNHMGPLKYPGIVVCLGGDMISGNIHEELRETNDGTVQQSILELQDQLCSALAHMADTFGRVFVPCVVGNHGRTTPKPRAKNRAFESYEWNLYHQLERHFRDDGRVHFFIPDGTDAHFTVFGHRFLLTHGDALGVKGGDGIIGALGPITRGAIKVGRSEAQIGRDFDTIIIGHWHMYTPRGEGSAAVVNGTLKGYDEYARLFLRVPYSRPSQALFFVHAKHGITAQWQVYVDGKKAAEEAGSVFPWLTHKEV